MRCPDRPRLGFANVEEYPHPRALVGFELGDAAQSVVGARVAGNKKAPRSCAAAEGTMYLLGESMGVPIDDIQVDAEIYLATKGHTSPRGFTVKEGTIGAFWFKLIGISSGNERFIINHVTRMGWEMAPKWPMLGDDGGYRIEIDSYPPLRADLPMALPGGTGSAFADVMAMTAARCVNSVQAVVTARPGYKTFLDLFPVGGKNTVAS
jgi:hypothetical protein